MGFDPLCIFVDDEGVGGESSGHIVLLGLLRGKQVIQDVFTGRLFLVLTALVAGKGVSAVFPHLIQSILQLSQLFGDFLRVVRAKSVIRWRFHGLSIVEMTIHHLVNHRLIKSLEIFPCLCCN